MGRYSIKELEKLSGIKAHTIRIREKLHNIIHLQRTRDFRSGFEGIKQLPKAARFGVYILYVYYLALFKKIKNTPSEKVLQSRIRIRNRHKAQFLAYSFFKHQLNML